MTDEFVPHRFHLVSSHGQYKGDRLAECVQFTDGSCVMRWLVPFNSMATFQSIADLLAAECDDGRYHLEWIDR